MSAPQEIEPDATTQQDTARLGSFVERIPADALRGLLAIRSAGQLLLEPVDYAARALNGKSHLPSMGLRRYAGPLASLETSAGEFSAYLKLLAHTKSGSRILDIGCGFGLVAIVLTEYVRSPGRYIGFDINKRAISWAQSHISKAHPNFEFVHLDIENGMYNPNGRLKATDIEFPVETGSCDVVLLKSVFTHLRPSEVASYLREVKRVLAPEGTCLATFFLLRHGAVSDAAPKLRFPYGEGGWRYAFRDLPELATAYSEAAMNDMLSAAQLNTVRAYPGTWTGARDGLTYQDLLVLVPA